MPSAPFLFVPTFSWPAAPFGLLYCYSAGSTTPKTTYSDAAGLVPNINPVELDSLGSATVRLGPGSYKFVLLDQTNTVTLWTQDNYDSLYLTAESVGAVLYPQTAAELAATVTPTLYQYPPGNPRRYGAVGDGITDDTTALTTCIACNDNYIGYPGDIYGVTTVTFPNGGPRRVDFNGSVIRGLATSATSAVVVISCNHTTFYNYFVDQKGGGGVIPNPNYTCGTWWSNTTNSTQFNTIYGCQHTQCTRGMVYGNLPGNAALSTIQSENAIYGWSTEGVINPFYGNSTQGFVHLSEPIFYTGVEGWTNPVIPTTARCLENIAGALYAQGGEIEFANVATGFAADLSNCTLFGMNWECSPPVQVVGDGVQVIAGKFLNNQQDKSAFVVASGVTGSLRVSDMLLQRLPGTGATSGQPLVDATAADATFTTVLSDTESHEWRWNLVGGNVRLISGGKSVYKNHRLSITAADSNIYLINTAPHVSLIPELTLDHLGYTTTGWTLVGGAGGSSLNNTTATGPTGYLASQLTLVATGSETAMSGDPTSLTTVKATMQRVRPGELYWGSGWAKITSGTSGRLVATFYDLTGAGVSVVPWADTTGIGTTAWTFCEGPVVVPATAAYMTIGAQITVSGTMLFTDMRVQRA